jgi:hypothetical protein
MPYHLDSHKREAVTWASLLSRFIKLLCWWKESVNDCMALYFSFHIIPFTSFSSLYFGRIFLLAFLLSWHDYCCCIVPLTVQKHQTLNVGFSYKLTCKGTWRQVFICLRPPGVVQQFCRFGIWSNTVSTHPDPIPPPPVTHCLNTYPIVYTMHWEG